MLTSNGGRPRRRERKKRHAKKQRKPLLLSKMAELMSDKNKLLVRSHRDQIRFG
jgi:hypothetical protein